MGVCAHLLGFREIADIAPRTFQHHPVTPAHTSLALRFAVASDAPIERVERDPRRLHRRLAALAFLRRFQLARRSPGAAPGYECLATIQVEPVEQGLAL